MISVRDRALTIACLHCQAEPGEPCRYPTGQIAVTHRVRGRMVFDGPGGALAKPCPECDAVPGMPCRTKRGKWTVTHSKRRDPSHVARNHGLPRVRAMPGVFSFKITHWQSVGSRTFVAVNVSVDGGECRRVGIELGPNELADRDVRAAVAAALAAQAKVEGMI